MRREKKCLHVYSLVVFLFGVVSLVLTSMVKIKIGLTVHHHKNQIQAVQLSTARSTHYVFR